MATFIIPNLLMALLILTPFIDRGPERRIQRRPIALFSGIAVIVMLGYLTNLGASSEESADAAALQLSGLESNEVALAGSVLWVENCTSCHQIGGVGQPGPGPNLSNVGTKGIVNADNAEEFLKNPPGSMPPFTNFTPQQYEEIGTFLGGLGTEFK
jgi:mono/diheme cytochrome c family protein